MIVLDTHVWIWWTHGDVQLPSDYHAFVQAHEEQGLGVSAISCWEVAKLVECGRLGLPHPVEKWLQQALSYPGVRLLNLSPQIAVESTQLPGTFHRDPATRSSWLRPACTAALWSRWTRTSAPTRTWRLSGNNSLTKHSIERGPDGILMDPLSTHGSHLWTYSPDL